MTVIEEPEMDFFGSKVTGSPSAPPLKSESEAIKAQLAKIQELAARNKQLANEVAVLKATAKGNIARDAPELVAELNRSPPMTSSCLFSTARPLAGTPACF